MTRRSSGTEPPGELRGTSPRERYIWVKQGNHLGEVDQLLEQCARQHGGEVVGDPDVLRSVGHTFLAAEGDWWRKYMAGYAKTHQWQKLSWERITRFLDERGS